MLKRFQYVLNNEEGASNIEIVVWISVILIILVVIYLFGDSIINFIRRGFGSMGKRHSGTSYISGS